MDFVWLATTRVAEAKKDRLLSYDKLAELIFYQIEEREPTIDDYDKIQKIRDELKKLQAYGVLLYDSVNRNVFLITDGEPTSSFNVNLTPWKNAIAEAEKLGKIDPHLIIIMLGKEYRFIELCNRMAKASRWAHVLYFSDPLNLKSFFVREFYPRIA